MNASKKPYLVIPKLIEQSTWGGTYISELKSWSEKPFLKDKKIGQSYELYGKSKLAISITDSRDERFTGEFGFADKPDTITDHFQLTENVDYISLDTLVENKKEAIVGADVYSKYKSMPLLNKINQAAGNSFQVHIKPSQSHPRWKAKPESWYYFEDGYLTCGVKKDVDLQAYKNVCNSINEKMKELSNEIQIGKRTLEDAKAIAMTFIKELNPWQFVNSHEVNKYDIIDVSAGGIHHSWEENREKFPLGNVLYEVQLDVMDPFCTIRAFDQGKIKDDGTVRELHIDDYFAFLDANPDLNDINFLKKERNGNNLIKTPFYSLDIIDVSSSTVESTANSFVHLYVRDGEVDIEASEGKVHLGKGHSCFIPAEVGEYSITASSPSTLLKTYIG